MPFLLPHQQHQSTVSMHFWHYISLQCISKILKVWFQCKGMDSHVEDESAVLYT